MTTPPVEEPPADSPKSAPAPSADAPSADAPAAAAPEADAPETDASDTAAETDAAEAKAEAKAEAEAALAEPVPAAELAADVSEPAPATEAPQPAPIADPPPAPVTEAVQPAVNDLPPNPNIDDLVALDRSTVTVARFADYAGAQQAVDYLSDNGFPVERSAIIGTDLRLVENVLGRLTIGRAAIAGVASGAWFGLFVGILFTLFSNSSWLGILLTTILVGALWGGVFGAIAHALTGGRRDFTSRSSLQAGQYAVTVEAEYADEARVLITRQNWRAANA